MKTVATGTQKYFSRPILAIILTWLLWLIILYGFQWLVTTRMDVKRPDTAVPWTETETRATSNIGKIYLEEPFLNRQVAWDSEYYLGIAVGGYDDPAAGRETSPFTGHTIPKNYSFFPFYPLVMKVLMFPLGIFGLKPIATAALAGVIISLLGTLAGLLALWDLSRDYFNEDDRMRSIFYLLIFPTGFFFGMVYTEGLFIGLAFWSLVLMKRNQWFWASLLAVLAAWTRAHGAILALPLIVSWLSSIRWRDNMRGQVDWKWIARGVVVILPLGAYALWRLSPLGEGWAELQAFYFGRGFLPIKASISSWMDMFYYATRMSKEGLIYYIIEVFTVLLAFASSIWLLRKDLPVALFSLGVVIFSVFSGSAQSMARYMIVVPAMYLFLATLGRHRTFDRAWTMISLLLMGMSIFLFSLDMWVG